MIKSVFNNDENFLDVVYEGTISIEDIIKHGTRITNNTELPRNLRILTDGRKATYQFTPEEMEEKMIKILKSHLETFDSLKNALIYTTPRETALSFLLEEQIPPERFKHKIFTSRQTALKWLLDDTE